MADKNCPTEVAFLPTSMPHELPGPVFLLHENSTLTPGATRPLAKFLGVPVGQADAAIAFGLADLRRLPGVPWMP